MVGREGRWRKNIFGGKKEIIKAIWEGKKYVWKEVDRKNEVHGENRGNSTEED